MAAAKARKFVKSKKAAVKIHLGKTQRVGRKEIELVISLPQAVARNLARRLKSRFPDLFA